MGEPIGRRVLDLILETGDLLRNNVRDFSDFEAGEPIYRINDWADYVSKEDWDHFWENYPFWWQQAWMLADNGQYSSEDVSDMTVEEIEAAYNDPDFCPEYAYYTEAEIPYVEPGIVVPLSYSRDNGATIQ